MFPEGSAEGRGGNGEILCQAGELGQEEDVHPHLLTQSLSPGPGIAPDPRVVGLADRAHATMSGQEVAQR